MEELQRQIEELKQRVETMEKAQNLDQNVLLFDYLVSDKTSDTLVRTITLTGNPQNIGVIADPVGTLKLNYKGTKYRIPLFSL